MGQPYRPEGEHTREAQLQLALDVAELGTWWIDLRDGSGHLDARAAEIVGLPAGAFADVARSQAQGTLPDDLDAVQAAVAEGIASGEAFTLNYRVRHPDGSVHHVTSRARVVTDAEGRPVRLVGTNRDVTAEREAEAERERLVAAREAAQQRVEFLAAASAALAESLDPEAVLRTVARLAIGTPDAPGLADACSLTLATPEEARAGRWRTIIEGLDPAKVALEVERQRRYPAAPEGSRGFPAVIRTGRSELVTPEMMEAQLRAVVHADPAHWAYFDALDLYAAVTAPLVARGRILGALTLVRHGPARRGAFDEADLALAEELSRRAAVALDNARLYAAAQQSRAEAEAAHAEAAAANRTKTEFLATMSHELRTPLNAIGGYAELIELGIRGPVTEAQREDLRRLQQSQRHLLGLINEVLNYAKLETGTVRYDLEPLVVREALAGAETLVAPQARAKGLALGVEACAPDVAVRADAEKLRQILVNLLSNAVKFTAPGRRIALRCDRVGSQVRVVVRDTGIGIAADQLERIFEPFVQVRADLARTAEGAGLGLAISRDLARGMGGDLTVESVPGEGSAFALTLPVSSSP